MDEIVKQIITLTTSLGRLVLPNKVLFKLKKFKLHKGYLVHDISEVALPPKLLHEKSNLDKEKIMKKMYATEILEISDRMSTILPNKVLFLQSINNVKVKHLKDKKDSYDNIAIICGSYNVRKNMIRVQTAEELPHELFHLASSYFDCKKKISYSGFSQINLKKHAYIGKGLTEGYSALLEKRYFQSEDTAYVLEEHFANILEMIIGEEKLFMLYCQADLFGLIMELSKYKELDEVINFIHGFEFINLNYLVKLDKNIVEGKLQSVAKFLVECYLRKIVDSQVNVSPEFIIISIAKFLNKMGSEIVIMDRNFSYFEPNWLSDLLYKVIKEKHGSSNIYIFNN